MREYLFRGKKVDNGEWVEGFYVCYGGAIPTPTHIIHDANNLNRLVGSNYEVDPDTVGMYTGLNDKNGLRIFEGDIIKATLPKQGVWSEITLACNQVYYDGSSYRVNQTEHPNSWVRLDSFATYVLIEIIGNIHDNPTLLEDNS